ncbi:MAG: glyoxalase/bleomycin resistance/extradiol dioxygenase family protein [Gammaproteobacteria bacterium]|nr:MAG: glyoxalase/bleomycin resistance/extradiol dioxygenase family protein [Gammaproteobacteria bacterium]
MRLQLALNVRNIEEAVHYYSKLFDTPPHKRRAGYANFAIGNPPLKLVLIENPSADDRINHLGVEAEQNENLDAVMKRLERDGIADTIEDQTTCCFATQDKVWSTEPQGLSWEWYTITDDNPSEANISKSSVCCA